MDSSVEKTRTQLLHELIETRKQIEELREAEAREKWNVEVLQDIVEGTSAATGEDFFRILTSKLASALQVRYAFITEFTEVKTRVRTLAFWTGNGFLDNFEYDLAGTPCELVLQGDIGHYPNGVQALFPQDKVLVKLGAESYLAIPLTDHVGTVLGHLAVVDDAPMPADPHHLSIFKIFTARAVAETKRKQAEASDQQTGERLRKIFEYSNDAIFIIDPERDRILEANPMACTMLGYSHEELLRTSITTIHPKEMPQLLAFAQSVFEKGYGWTDELTCFTKAGQTLPAEISSSVIDLGGRRSLLALVRNITERKAAEEALRERERLALLNAHVSNAMTYDGPLRNDLQTCVEGLVQYLHGAFARIWTLDEEEQILVLQASAGLYTGTTGSHARIPVGELKIGLIAKERQPHLTNSVIGDSRVHDQEWAKQEGMVAFAGYPLIVGDRVVGVMAMFSQHPLAPTALQAMETVAKKIAVGIDRKQTEAKLNSLAQTTLYLQEEINAQHNFEELIGASPTIRKVFQDVEQVAGTDSTVLVTGETGTGKELIARAIHARSSKKDKALVKLNCAAIPEGLVESELFGHEKGAFTGALTKKVGRFELADGGTLFLDEIGELSIDLQSKLLRVLQEGEFERVGGTRTFHVNVRVIAATNRNPQEAMQAGLLRPDLYYRLNVFPIQLPPLRERKEDIPLLVQYFANKKGAGMGKKIETVPDHVMKALKNYSWPGNIRELEHVIERALILSSGSQLELGHWLEQPTQPARPRVQTLEEMERDHILSVLKTTGWVVSGEQGAAQILGLKRTTLEARMKKLGIVRPS